jgi:hypothetical protein
MWLATKSGFFSVVVDTTKPGWMLVRARAKADLANLYRDYSESCPSMTSLTAREDRDYRWRMGIAREDWIFLAGRLAASVDYSNFKNSVQERSDQANKSGSYLAIWSTMRRIQEGEEPEPAPQPWKCKPPKKEKRRKR